MVLVVANGPDSVSKFQAMQKQVYEVMNSDFGWKKITWPKTENKHTWTLKRFVARKSVLNSCRVYTMEQWRFKGNNSQHGADRWASADRTSFKNPIRYVGHVRRRHNHRSLPLLSAPPPVLLLHKYISRPNPDRGDVSHIKRRRAVLAYCLVGRFGSVLAVLIKSGQIAILRSLARATRKQNQPYGIAKTKDRPRGSSARSLAPPRKYLDKSCDACAVTKVLVRREITGKAPAGRPPDGDRRNGRTDHAVTALADQLTRDCINSCGPVASPVETLDWISSLTCGWIHQQPSAIRRIISRPVRMGYSYRNDTRCQSVCISFSVTSEYLRN